VSEAAELAERLRFGVVVDSPEAVDALVATETQFRVWLKVDAGYHRAGVAPDSDEALEIPMRIDAAGSLEFAGLLSHSGNAYHAGSPGQITRVANEERDVLNALSAHIERQGITVRDRSGGSTPSMSRVSDLSGMTEVRPGNYALYDWTQVALGSCGLGQCAATVLASVVSSHTNDRRSVIDAGALALSADPGPAHVRTGGMGVLLDPDSPHAVRHNATILSLSQEHGVVSDALPLGSRVRVVPNHSCLAVACFDRFFVVQGEEVLDHWTIHRGR
jgi:D-serine deaminase-like pyridoxal phosphate-dependent protein